MSLHSAIRASYLDSSPIVALYIFLYFDISAFLSVFVDELVFERNLLLGRGSDTCITHCLDSLKIYFNFILLLEHLEDLADAKCPILDLIDIEHGLVPNLAATRLAVAHVGYCRHHASDRDMYSPVKLLLIAFWVDDTTFHSASPQSRA
uniref:Uncharacterized protein n=1 Tax=Caudovirales sp. ct1Jx6 TaxID=2826765 RepID=A0A8S5ML65_9CAUD|nr:MAG TPA: hypothetical protein [Caudovirales sp. ct1Jx6]